MADFWGYENDADEEIWTMSAMTRGGAFGLAKTMKDKFGVEVLEKPFERDDGVWVFMITNPLKKVK